MLLNCKECKKEISNTAGVCPNCGCKKPFSGIQLLNKDIKNWKPSEKSAFLKSGGEIKLNFGPLKKLFFGSIILFSILVVFGMIEESRLAPEEKAARAEERATRKIERDRQEAERKALDEEKRCSNETMAFVMSQNFVKRELKSPASASFPSTSSQGVRTNYIGDCTHEVWAYVDAQNSFGANIRTEYYVKIKNEKGTNSWSLLDIRM